ncbi:MAG: T9SS type A sorting domain-containing protein [Bacteroidota bacterium]
MLVFLFTGFGAQAQIKYLTATPITVDHNLIMANKAPVPGTQVIPTSPMAADPVLTFAPDAINGDAEYWHQRRRNRVLARPAKTGSSSNRGPLNYTERETTEGANDTPGTAERIRSFGLRSGQRNVACISGNLPDLPARVLTQAEDDGAIPLALDLATTGAAESVSFSGTIGDGPMAGTVSDYDYARVFLPAGTTFSIAVRTPEPFGDLDPFVTLLLPTGQIIFTQDDGGDGFDTFVTLTVGANDLDFLIAIGGFGAFEPADPFNSTGGSATGLIGSEGTYEFELVVQGATSDLDFYKVHLEKGDVVGAALDIPGGNPSIQIFNSKGELEKGVNGFGSFADPASPLPINGNGAIDYIIERNDDYTIGVGGFGDYKLTVGVYPSEFEREKGRVQLLWIDYNGGPVDKAPWFGVSVVTDHSPFRDFLPNLGLPSAPADVRRITSKITAEVRDNVYTELDRTNLNRNLGVVVLGNDGTGAPTIFDALVASGSFSLFGITFEVSELEVSGTTNEALINTIGIASTIDPGNYSVNDVALVLLDVLTAPATGISANFSFTLNDILLAPGVTKEDMVTTVLGNIVAHEGGHYIGNWHTDGFSNIQSIMDEGPGGLFNLAGIGPSGIFGGADATDVGFNVTDAYSPTELFVGDENIAINTVIGLSFFPFYNFNALTDMPVEIAEQLNPTEFLNRTLLDQSIPNSLSVGGNATIRFEVEHDTEAVLDIYDMAGNKVGNLFEGAVKGGESNVVTLKAGDFNLKPGVYLYKLDTPTGSKHRKIVVKE